MAAALSDLSRYAVASAFSFVFVVVATACFHEAVGLAETLAPIPALVLAFAINFTLLRRWVFPRQVVPVARQVAETVIVSIAFRALEYGLFLALHLGLDLNYLIATGASLCISAAGKFAVYREIVFSRARTPRPAPGAGSR